MSARAAARLEGLGFSHVRRYRAGVADWFAAGLARAGRDAHTPRVGDVARRDVPTCRADERVGRVRDRLRHGGWDVCVVVDAQRVVQGLVLAESLDGDPGAPVEAIMQSAPITLRPDVGAGQLPDYLRTQRNARMLVTTSDGVLVGLLRREDPDP